MIFCLAIPHRNNYGGKCHLSNSFQSSQRSIAAVNGMLDNDWSNHDAMFGQCTSEAALDAGCLIHLGYFKAP